jgi:hypothetical protein
MRIATTVSVDKAGKSKVVSGPDVSADTQRKAFESTTVPEGGSLILWLSGSAQPRVRKV